MSFSLEADVKELMPPEGESLSRRLSHRSDESLSRCKPRILKHLDTSGLPKGCQVYRFFMIAVVHQRPTAAAGVS